VLDNKRQKLSIRLVHLLIALIAPFTFILALTAVFEAASRQALSILPHEFLVIFLVGVVKTVFNRHFVKERVFFIHVVREFILTLAVLYVVISLLRGTGLTALVNPGFVTIYLVSAGAIQWIGTYHIDRALIFRERLLQQIAESSASPALELENKLKKAGPDQGLFYSQLKKVKRILSIFFFVLFCFLFILIQSKIRFTSVELFWVFLFLGVFIISNMILNFFLEEHSHYYEGIKLIQSRLKRRFLFTLLILFCVAFFAVIIADNQSIIDLSTFKIHFPQLARGEDSTEPMTGNPYIAELIKNMQMLRDQTGIPEWIIRLMQFLFYFIPGVLIAIFLFKPFLTGNFREFMRSRHPLRFLAKQMSRLVQFINAAREDIRIFFGNFFKKGSRRRKQERKKGKHAIPVISGGKESKSFKKVIETNRITGLFLRLIRWAKKKKIYYYHGQTATEYILTLTGRFPETSDSFYYILSVFEKAVFSQHILGRASLKNYASLIKRITRTVK
jgi:hypothetical protein